MMWSIRYWTGEDRSFDRLYTSYGPGGFLVKYLGIPAGVFTFFMINGSVCWDAKHPKLAGALNVVLLGLLLWQSIVLSVPGGFLFFYGILFGGALSIIGNALKK